MKGAKFAANYRLKPIDSQEENTVVNKGKINPAETNVTKQISNSQQTEKLTFHSRLKEPPKSDRHANLTRSIEDCKMKMVMSRVVTANKIAKHPFTNNVNNN